MASNNYALIISDPTKARWVLTDLNRMASRGGAFKVLKFNPASDRFPISCGRESNLPPLLYVEEDGTTVDGAIVQAQWSSGNTVEAIDFGNGVFGFFCESAGLGYMAIPALVGSNLTNT